VIINTSLHSVRVRDSRQVLQDELGVVAVLYKPMATLADICHTVREHSGGVL
jgi:hypothetical protein